LHDRLGRVVYQEKLFQNMETDHLIITGQLSKGIYFMRISEHGKLVHSEKIILN